MTNQQVLDIHKEADKKDLGEETVVFVKQDTPSEIEKEWPKVDVIVVLPTNLYDVLLGGFSYFRNGNGRIVQVSIAQFKNELINFATELGEGYKIVSFLLSEEEQKAVNEVINQVLPK